MLNHKPTKALHVTHQARVVCIRSWLPAEDSVVRGKPLQLGRTYNSRQKLGVLDRQEGNGKPPWQIRDIIFMAPIHDMV